MDTLPVNSKDSPRAQLPAALKFLREMVSERHRSYRNADYLIVRNLESGERRRYGKAKLKLSMDKLAEHMAAVETRRRMHRQLQVLVPLRHRLVLCAQMQDTTGDAFDTALNPLKAKLAAYTCAVGSARDYEKPLADLLITAFPDLLKTDVSAEPAPAPAVDEPKVDKKREKLYSKIISAGLLSGKEIEDLRIIFWG